MSITSPTNFLEIVQRVSTECGIPTAPTTLLGATGQTLDLMNWTSQAWTELQQKYPDWSFMYVSPGVSFVTVAGQTQYTATQAGVTIGDVSLWDRNSFRIYNTAAGQATETDLYYVPYAQWKDGYNKGSLRTTQRMPAVFSIHPQNHLILECPLVGYTVTGDYYRLPTVLALDADVPTDLPIMYYMLIVAKAMEKYALFESAPEVLAASERLGNRLMNSLENTRSTEVSTGGALA